MNDIVFSDLGKRISVISEEDARQQQRRLCACPGCISGGEVDPLFE